MSDWPAFRLNGMTNVLSCRRQVDYWSERFQLVFDNKIDTWDYQWQFEIWKNGGKCIVPQQNLVKNIGFGAYATHTIDRNPLFEMMEAERLIYVNAPSSTRINQEADDLVFETIFMPTERPLSKGPYRRFFDWAKTLRLR